MKRRVNPDTLIALALGLGTVLLLVLTSSGGFVRDEGYYFRAARDYHGWFEAVWKNLMAGDVWVSFGDPALRRAFGYNTEHPGALKIAMGWTHKIFTVWLGWTDHATGYRLASMAFVGLGSAFTYLLGRTFLSRFASFLGVVLVLACPHVFYHSHLACFDGPIMGLTVAVVYTFWRSLHHRGWVIGAGLVWGLAIASKHNALFLPPVLLMAYVVAHADKLRLRAGSLSLPPLPLSFLSMTVLGPLVFLAFYPVSWHDPIERINDYLRFHLYHEHYPVDYFGALLTEPPFPVAFPFVMTALTVPLIVLLPGVVGWLVMLVRAVRHSVHGFQGVSSGDGVMPWLLVVSTLVPLVIIAVPSVPIFGGTKHWMTMMPFLCLLAAWVITGAARWALDNLPRTGLLVAPGLVVLTVLLPAIDTARTHPDGQTYYNELAGGHQGGAAMRLPRTFWGGDARVLLSTLNERAPNGARVFTDRMNQDDFQAYRRDGLVRSDLRWVLEIKNAQWAIINHQREFLDSEYEVWQRMGHRKPVAVYTFDGVAISSLYDIAGGR